MKIFMIICFILIGCGVFFGLCGLIINNAEKRKEKKERREYAQFIPKNKTDF